MIWLHGLYLQQYWDSFPWFVIMVYTTFRGIGLPVHDLASWFVSTTILGWFSMVCHHGLYYFPGIGLHVHDLASWFVFTTILGWFSMVCHHGLYHYASNSHACP
jgi:hypothetical protein